MTTYKSLKSLCESLGMSYFETPELSDQELNKTPDFESNTRTGGFEGFFHSEETKKQMSEQRKGRVFTPEWREKLNATRKGKKHTEESKKRMSDARKGIPVSEETRKRISLSKSGDKHPNYGKKHSPETIAKMKEARQKRIGIPVSEETRKKLSDAAKNRKNKEET